ncbi:neural cell adhesion molecule 1-like isoform X2 [Daktulosphaira vitifoliae]|uniref:neural cell adhesion molecule 1-like isoform X2 n=1 Tax=Daktulosphaira vitifoliae TaxID=58002 RepID=UPI0021AAC25C|nr:neural cell adhesion molecule 1-like isoform X2 [Daktulosphaira vitifoliae]
MRLRRKLNALIADDYVMSQYMHITPNDMEPVREERSKYGVTCYGPNLSGFQWRGPKGPISQSSQIRVHSQDLIMPNNQTGLLLVFEKVLEEDKGNYTCTDRKGHSVVIKLTVTRVLEFDTPRVQTTKEHEDYLISCKVKGNVKPTFMWTFKSLTIKEGTKSGKYSVEEDGLLVRNVSHLDAGKYTCRAFQTTDDSSVSEDTEIDLVVKHKPVFLELMEGNPIKQYVFSSESANLSCQHSAEPSANVTWSFNGKTFLNSYDHYIVTFNKPEKLGLYTCTVSNSLGTITRRYNLIEGFKPKTPRDLSIIRVGDNYIELTISPNDKSDELVGYRVEYTEKVVKHNSLTYESFNIMNFNTTEGPFALAYLKPNTEYTIKILARNNAGISEFTEPITVRTLAAASDGILSCNTCNYLLFNAIIIVIKIALL